MLFAAVTVVYVSKHPDRMERLEMRGSEMSGDPDIFDVFDTQPKAQPLRFLAEPDDEDENEVSAGEAVEVIRS